ncbi:MAG: hypothetical protein ISS19_14280 [Bacteroidales bacterium]|nr:hypothetical protein [Bacteroidales bacterium]
MAISDRTRKIIWARSGNRCAICQIELVQEKDPYNVHLNLGEECHIISKQPKGPRYFQITDFDYDGGDNLLLLCCNHHKMIDEQSESFPLEKLIQIKINHENWVKSTLGVSEPTDTTVNAQNHLINLIGFVSSKHDIEMNIQSSKQIYNTEKGLQLAFTEVESIQSQITSMVQAIQKSSPQYRIEVRNNNNRICDIRFKGFTFLAQFYQAYSNVAHDSYLLFGIVDGLFRPNGMAEDTAFHMPHLLDIIRLDFTVNDEGVFGWADQTNKSNFYSSKEITYIWVTKFFKRVLQ